MIALYILLGLLALVLLLLFLPIDVQLRVTQSNTFSCRIKAAVFPVFTHPAKKKAFHPRAYSPRAVKKREKKAARALARKQKKQAKKQVSRKASSTPTPGAAQKIKQLTELLSLITSLLEHLHERLLHATHIHLYRLQLRIGSDDAAKTALLYGAICPAIRGMMMILHEKTNLHVHHPKQIAVLPDFVHDTFDLELDATIRLRVHHAISLAIAALIHILKYKSSRRTRANHTPTDMA